MVRFAIHSLILSIFLQNYSSNNKDKVQDQKHDKVVRNVEVKKSTANLKKTEEK